MKKHLILLALCFVLHAQAEIYNFARFDNTHGLSNNQIECTFKDSRGFIWFGTNYGLNRYDGYKVKVYKPIKTDTTSIPFNAISQIQEDGQGNLWIRGGGSLALYNLHTEKFTRNLTLVYEGYGLKFSPSLVEIDNQKNLFFYRPSGGVYKYDQIQKKLIHYKQSCNPRDLSLGTIIRIRAQKGSFWVLFQSGLLERFNEKTGSVDFRNQYVKENAQGATLIKDLFIDSDGCPWVFPGIADKGILYFDWTKSAWIFFGNDKADFRSPADRYLASNFVRDIAQDQKGHIWIATDHGGVNIYDKKNSEMAVLLNDPMNPNSVSQNSVISLYSDNTGIMWVGTYKNGVAYYHPGMFKFEKSPLFFFNPPTLETKDCNILYEDRSENVWIGTNGSGVLKWNKTNGEFQLFRNEKSNPSSISSDIVISMLEDKKGTMWFGTFLGGLNHLVGNKFNRLQSDVKNKNSLSNKSVYGLVEDRKQNIWIATLGGGLDMLEPTRANFTHHRIANASGISSDYILSLYSKDTTLVYLCTSLGVDVLNTETNVIRPVFENQKQRNKLSDLIVYNVLVDCRNQLWIATDNGINVYNPIQKTISYINTSNGLPSDQVVSLVEDNDGNIWVGTRNGLACVYCKKAYNQKYTYSVVSFDENDGLPSSIFNQNAVFKNKSGQIYIGCTKGYVVFNPRNIRFNTIVPQPRFTDLIVNGQEIKPDCEYNKHIVLNQAISHLNKIVLHHDDKNFTINFSALSYIHPEKNRYRYKLEGFDEKWTEIRSNNGSASYSNLNQGTYRLLVYACNNDHIWNKTPLVLTIVVQPPFWLAWYAIILYIILVFIILWYIIKFNLRKQQREFEHTQRINQAKQVHEIDEMKFRFFTNISHEFRTPLTLIISPVEKLLREAKTEEEKSLLSIINRNAHGLLELVNQLLDFRKLDVQKDSLNISVGDIVAYIKDICYSFTELANRKSINFAFSTSVSELRMEFDPEKMKKIVHNLLSNAFKFTPNNGKIEVNLSLIQQLNDDLKFFKLTVSDTGIGIPAKDLERIFDRFYRVENAENGNQTGTGVGLHIASEYAKLHRGDIGVESVQGKGSTFTVMIPANQHIHEEMIVETTVIVDDVPDELTPEEEAISEEIKNKMPLMLIVDDNEDFRNFISALFTDNYRIIKAEDGEQAHQLILDKMPDIIICDVMMPKMDGFELCKLVKQDIRISHIPIILLTAKAGEENKYKGLEAGAEDYIAKPFNMEMLSLKVSRIIDRQKKTREQFKRKVDITTGELEITSMDEKFVKKAVALVEENLSSAEFLVEDLCREMGMSRVYFYKKILSLTDKTPSEFIRFIRLKRAADLLEKSQLFVNEVAYQVGFNDPKYFRKYFKDEYGLSPNEYKKKFVN